MFCPHGYVHAHGYECMPGAPGGQKMESDTRELELQTVVIGHGGAGA